MGERLRWQASSYRGGRCFHNPPPPTHTPRRSRLAGEEARKACSAWANAFAGKPAPTEGGSCFHNPPPHTFPVGAGLPAKRPARHAALGRTPSLASQLLPRGALFPQSAPAHTFPVGAGLPAKRPARQAALGRTPSLASQLLHGASWGVWLAYTGELFARDAEYAQDGALSGPGFEPGGLYGLQVGAQLESRPARRLDRLAHTVW
ncbi:hypothetical protein SAMN05216178_3463 [Pseudomonas saponiphila]|uniref:Uncharacterized protein n=1 Tax=Pseudomonas saponiphila TaxID=556534 RepID=A0A1H4PT83_9PSED|nr:hypothetical protein SAMN05216178_3463 [Pseudomonas saponiphila]